MNSTRVPDKSLASCPPLSLKGSDQNKNAPKKEGLHRLWIPFSTIPATLLVLCCTLLLWSACTIVIHDDGSGPGAVEPRRAHLLVAVSVDRSVASLAPELEGILLELATELAQQAQPVVIEKVALVPLDHQRGSEPELIYTQSLSRDAIENYLAWQRQGAGLGVLSQGAGSSGSHGSGSDDSGSQGSGNSGSPGSGSDGSGDSGSCVSEPGVSEPGDPGPGDSGAGDSGPGDSGPGDSGPGDSGVGDSGAGDSGPGVSEPGDPGSGDWDDPETPVSDDPCDPDGVVSSDDPEGPGQPTCEPGGSGSNPGWPEPGEEEPGVSDGDSCAPREGGPGAPGDQDGTNMPQIDEWVDVPGDDSPWGQMHGGLSAAIWGAASNPDFIKLENVGEHHALARLGAVLGEKLELQPRIDGGERRPFFDEVPDLLIVLNFSHLRRACAFDNADCRLEQERPDRFFSHTDSQGNLRWIEYSGGLRLSKEQVFHLSFATAEGVAEDPFYSSCLKLPGFPPSLAESIEPSPKAYYGPFSEQYAQASGGRALMIELCPLLASSRSQQIRSLAETLSKATRTSP